MHSAILHRILLSVRIERLTTKEERSDLRLRQDAENTHRPALDTVKAATPSVLKTTHNFSERGITIGCMTLLVLTVVCLGG